jgi:hypothetical protein
MRKKARRPTQFGVCTDNSGYPASLEVGKLYPVIPDAEAAKHGYIRVIDESGEDYGYSAERFFLLEIPEALAKVLSAGAASRPNPTAQPFLASRRQAERVSR